MHECGFCGCLYCPLLLLLLLLIQVSASGLADYLVVVCSLDRLIWLVTAHYSVMHFICTVVKNFSG